MNEFLLLVRPEMLLYLVAFLAYIFSVRTITPFSFVIVGVMFLEVLHQGLTLFLNSSMKTEDHVTQVLVFHAWYIGFALTDFIFVSLIYLLSRWLNVNLGLTCQLIAAAFLILGCLQIVGYVDGLFFDGTDWVAFIYTNSIPVINYLIFIILMGHVVVTALRSSVRYWRTS
ncbi:hypothetical protein DXV75_13630 [Alteromonas aestuariivivens]|uniref:Uncharacterized protein n=1 Tax=Alteromonas aestuariivivens TaxID=1938339 RepID=A0A3D8M499_9ALTE|nr:hypothetical protein [Alteromonas aestuariivivens]RDV24461.1 hypothetical protein DXV75_13630 [Alteromonas aestuariivivens]